MLGTDVTTGCVKGKAGLESDAPTTLPLPVLHLCKMAEHPRGLPRKATKALWLLQHHGTLSMGLRVGNF